MLGLFYNTGELNISIHEEDEVVIVMMVHDDGASVDIWMMMHPQQ